MPEPWRKTGRSASDGHFLGLEPLGIVEAAAYHEDGTRMGHVLLQLTRKDPLGSDRDEGQTWGAAMLGIEDKYYEWWFKSTFGELNGRPEIYVHFCKVPLSSCMVQGGYGNLIHVDVFRLVTVDEMEATRWLTGTAKIEAKDLVRFKETVTLDPSTPAAPTGIVQPGAAGVTGLRAALEAKVPDRWGG